MSVLRDMSIGRKLTVIILSITTVSLLLACAVLVGYDLVMYRRAMVRDVSTLADMVADNSTAALTFHDEQAARTFCGLCARNLTSPRLACTPRMERFSLSTSATGRSRLFLRRVHARAGVSLKTTACSSSVRSVSARTRSARFTWNRIFLK